MPYTGLENLGFAMVGDKGFRWQVSMVRVSPSTRAYWRALPKAIKGARGISCVKAGERVVPIAGVKMRGLREGCGQNQGLERPPAPDRRRGTRNRGCETGDRGRGLGYDQTQKITCNWPMPLS